jgi:endo-1,4-beta-xylanase
VSGDYPADTFFIFTSKMIISVMARIMSLFKLATILPILIASCTRDPDPLLEIKIPKSIEEYNLVSDGLKDYFTSDEYFDMGVAVKTSFFTDPQSSSLIKRHFNSLTAENVMKWSTLQPTEGNFNFTEADKIIDFAVANGMKVRGHTLIWHNQTPSWVFMDGTATASKELVLQRLRAHITAVMHHFQGKVYAWDVVNEAIDDGSATYRESAWYAICGIDFITGAFEAARAADPEAKLFYNDYSAIGPTKRDKIYNLLVMLKNNGLVDGIGVQGHWNIEWPSNDLITAAFEKFSSAGVEIQITELDVSVYTSNSDPESAYTSGMALDQANAYDRFFKAFREYKSEITSITWWGLADNYTWLDDFPVSGRKNFPFLFDVKYDPKLAYFTIIDFKPGE